MGAIFPISAMSYSSKNMEEDCYDRVHMTIIQADNAGLSVEEIEQIAQIALAVYCYGYDLEDIR